MNTAQATAAVAAALAGIAPEVDITAVDPDIRFRDELDLDSLDFLSLVQSLHDAIGVEIPEADYGKVETLNTLVDYLVQHSPVAVSG